MTTPPTAQSSVAQPKPRTVTFRMTESEAAKYGLSNRWQKAIQRRQEREFRKKASSERLEKTVSQLLERAQIGDQDKPWSQRTLCSKIGIPEASFRYCRSGHADPAAWLPKLEAALSHLKAS